MIRKSLEEKNMSPMRTVIIIVSVLDIYNLTAIKLIYLNYSTEVLEIL